MNIHEDRVKVILPKLGVPVRTDISAAKSVDDVRDTVRTLNLKKTPEIG